MTFDNSQMTLIHLVSFPSLWLPPPSTLKALVVGLSQSEIEQLVEHCQLNFADYSFAFYHVPDINWEQADNIDWLLVNQHHMHGTFVKITSWATLSLAISSKGLVQTNIEQASPEIQKMAEYSGASFANLTSFALTLTTNSRTV